VRIVAGRWRGRRIAVPEGPVRPTADKVREAWMSIVTPWIGEARVLDLCAGSGALGLEALSRGAAHATFVEQDPRVRRVLLENIAFLGAGPRATVVAEDAAQFVRTLPAASFDLAFADPPYASPLAEQIAAQWATVPFATHIGIEHAAQAPLPTSGDTRRYGATAITFYSVADPRD
jgi:16S rRNA (guanine966-N2)-methyltransferase